MIYIYSFILVPQVTPPISKHHRFPPHQPAPQVAHPITQQCRLPTLSTNPRLPAHTHDKDSATHHTCPVLHSTTPQRAATRTTPYV